MVWSGPDSYWGVSYLVAPIELCFFAEILIFHENLSLRYLL